jgi:hypothetical protein
MYLKKTVQECELNSAGSVLGPGRRPHMNILSGLWVPKNDGALDQLGKYLHLMKNLLCLQILGDPKSHIYINIVLSQYLNWRELLNLTQISVNISIMIKLEKILITYYKLKGHIHNC